MLVPEQPEVPNEVRNLLNLIIGFEISRSSQLGISEIVSVRRDSFCVPFFWH